MDAVGFTEAPMIFSKSLTNHRVKSVKKNLKKKAAKLAQDKLLQQCWLKKLGRGNFEWHQNTTPQKVCQKNQHSHMVMGI